MHALFSWDETLTMDGARTLTRTCRPFGNVYNIQDAEILCSTPKAAEIYGYESPKEMEGLLLAWTQDPADRLQGRFAWSLRRQGYDVPEHYFAKIVRPDGEVVVVHKKVEKVPMTSGGAEVFLTSLEVVKEAWKEPPDISGYDVDPASIRSLIGYTPREAMDPELQNKLQLTDNVRKLVSDYGHLLSSVHGPQFDWTRVPGQGTDRVRQLNKCMNCGHIWFGNLTRKTPQCSACRLQPGRTAAGAYR